MTKYEQLEFIPRLGLDLKQNSSGFNGRCPICGDSQKSKHKKRFWLLTQKNTETILVFCHNCGYSSNFKNFLKDFKEPIYKDYIQYEKLLFIQGIKTGSFKLKEKTLDIKTNQHLKYTFNLNKRYFKPANIFPEAIEFCRSRKIIDKIDTLYYNVNTKSILYGMVIFPFTLPNGKVYGFMGRHTKNKLFHVYCKNESFKNFGVFEVDKNQPIIIVESIIDSLNIKNSVAMVGADLSQGVKEYLKKCNLLFAFDSDNTGISKANKYAEQGYKVFVWPKYLKVKDFNDLSLLGWSNDEITQLIYENSFSGIELKVYLKFKNMEKRR